MKMYTNPKTRSPQFIAAAFVFYSLDPLQKDRLPDSASFLYVHPV